MKRIRRLAPALLLSLVLFVTTIGCGKEATKLDKIKENLKEYETVVYEQKLNEQSISRLTFYHDGKGWAYGQLAEDVIYFEEMGIEDKEAEKKRITQLNESYNRADGMAYELDFQDDHYLERLYVDYREINPEQTKGLQGVSLKKSGPIELAKFEKSLTEQGYVKK